MYDRSLSENFWNGLSMQAAAASGRRISSFKFQTFSELVYPRKKISINTATIHGLKSCSFERLLCTAKVRPFIRFFYTAWNRDILKPRLSMVFGKKWIHFLVVYYFWHLSGNPRLPTVATDLRSHYGDLTPRSTRIIPLSILNSFATC
jgi:hypothetical protein